MSARPKLAPVPSAPKPKLRRVTMARALEIGEWFQKHYDRRRLDVGVFAAAKQLRKQGVPIDIALLLLTR